MGFIDFTILPDGKIRINRTWNSPNKYSKKKKEKSKFEGTKKGRGIVL